MSGPTPQQKLAVLERRKKVAARYVRGAPQWEIARAFEVDQATISRDLAAIREEWLSGAKLDYDAIVSRELAKVDETEKQAWEAWQRSCQNAETLKARMRGQETTTEKLSKGQAGDPRFLDVVLRCVERRCKILGVDAPPRAFGGDEPYKVYMGFSPEEVLCPEKPKQPTSPPDDAPTAPEGPPSR